MTINRSTYQRAVITTIIGNTMEWYCLALYGYYATRIAVQFFPLEDETLSYLLVFILFAIGYLIRPIGGIIFGVIGDRVGRRLSLLLSLTLLTAATTAIGLLPTFNEIGIWAPVLLLLARCIQSIAVSAEIAGCVAFLMESVSKSKQGFYGSFIMATTFLGFLLGSMVCWGISLVFSEQALINYGWRIPFIFALPIGGFAILLRYRCGESEEFQSLSKQKCGTENSQTTSLINILQQIVHIILLTIPLAIVSYMLTSFLPSYLLTVQNIEFQTTFLLIKSTLVTTIILTPFMGKIADRKGASNLLQVGYMGLLIAIAPIILGLTSSFPLVIISCLFLGVLLAPITGSICTVLAINTQIQTRYTSLGIGYNISMCVFGGTTPVILFYFLSVKMQPWLAIIYISLACLLGVLACSVSNLFRYRAKSYFA